MSITELIVPLMALAFGAGYISMWFVNIRANRQKERLLTDQETKISQKLAELRSQEASVQELVADLATQTKAFKSVEAERHEALAKILDLSPEEAKTILLAEIRSQIESELGTEAVNYLNTGTQADEQAARRVFLSVIQRNSARWTGDDTVVAFALPSDEYKGRLIGRDGRNFKSFEQVTGTSLIIDDTPSTVFISSFDPVRRAQAHSTLAGLILDGRIHPGMIEELFAEVVTKFDENLVHIGADASSRAGVAGQTDQTLIALGRLKFRNSMSQNMLEHSIEVACFAAGLATEIHLDPVVARTAGLLHDIGKGLAPEWGSSHALAGAAFLRSQNVSEAVVHCVEAHHYEVEPTTPEATVLIAADSASGSRPGARHMAADLFQARMAKIQQTVGSLEGVERVDVFDAGKEIRVFVKPDKVSDLAAAQLAKRAVRVAKDSSEYAVPVRVTVIRETRVIEVSK